LEPEKGLTESVKGTMGANLGRAHGAFEDSGDFRERELFETGEQEHFPVLAIELGEGGAKQLVVVPDGGLLVRPGRRVANIGECFRIGGVGRSGGPPEVIGGAAAREVVHPSGKASVVTIGVAVLQHSLKHSLDDVFGGGALAGEFEEVAVERSVVAFEKLAQGVEFAVAHGEHQCVVGDVCFG
jgi:hypothetical protein